MKTQTQTPRKPIYRATIRKTIIYNPQTKKPLFKSYDIWLGNYRGKLPEFINLDIELNNEFMKLLQKCMEKRQCYEISSKKYNIGSHREVEEKTYKITKKIWDHFKHMYTQIMIELAREGIDP